MNAETNSKLRRPISLRWAEAKLGAEWIEGTTKDPHSQAFAYAMLQAPETTMRPILIPSGTTYSGGQAKADKVFLIMDGALDITVDDRAESYGEHDLVAVTAGTRFTLANPGLDGAVVCEIAAKTNARTDVDAAPPAMRFQEYKNRFSWTLPWAERFGYHRGSGPLIVTDEIRGHTVRMPVGQATPWHYAARDLMFMGIHNEVTFMADGQSFPLRRFDMLLIPSGVPYSYKNVDFGEAFFISIGGKLIPGNKGTYFDADPGYPVNPAARTLEVYIDANGDAKLR
ncbi:hypothetical protein BH09PSE6_BH09PSE6_08850 [soil metagenome]